MKKTFVLALIAVGVNTIGCSAGSPGHEPEQRAGTIEAALLTTYRGVNLASAEFAVDPWGAGALPGTHGSDYWYPDPAYVPGYTSADYYVGKGMNTFRLPFRWERLQRTRLGAFDATELGRLRTTVNNLTAKGATVILDPHNYARYGANVIGSSTVPNSHFADFWSRLANEFKANSKVAFGLMNEPHDMPTEQWVNAAKAAISAIRATAATNLILVPGNGWDGAHSWTQNWYGTPNADAMKGITDSNMAFEVHQYLDGDSSGTVDTCVSNTIGAERLATFTSWLKANGRKGFLGEFGAGSGTTCQNALDGMLDHLEANTDVWIGWTYWAGGPKWGSYFTSLEPSGGVDRPQMDTLESHLSGSAPPPAASCSDNVKNGTETDVDCGGSCTANCANGKTCSANADCTSNNCVSGTCQAVATGTATLKAQYKAGDTLTGNNVIKPHVQVVNTGTAGAPLSEAKLRYWFSNETSGPLQFTCETATVGCANVTGTFGTSNGNTYLEIGFTTGAGSIAAGGRSSAQVRINNSASANFNETNDYSFDATKTAYADWTRVTLRRNGTLVWGTEPAPVTTTGGPCANLCSNPIVFTAKSYQSGNLGTAATCHQTTTAISGGNCGNMGTRTFKVNGTTVACSGGNWSGLPAMVNGGYCFQATAGDPSWAYFTTF